MTEKVKVVFTLKEKALLASLVEVHKDELESKKTDSTTNSLKNQAWQNIAEQYNSHDVTGRTAGQLKKCWDNMKYKTRKADTKTRHNMLLTGGGPPEVETNIIDDMVRSIVPTINYTVTNTWDSSAIFETDEIHTKTHKVHVPDVTNMEVYTEQPIFSPSYKKNRNVDNNLNAPDTETITQQSDQIIDDEPNPSSRKVISTSKPFTPKRKRISAIDEEKELRLLKLREGIEQQKELHELRKGAVEAEKMYWLEKRRLLPTNSSKN